MPCAMQEESFEQMEVESGQCGHLKSSDGGLCPSEKTELYVLRASVVDLEGRS